MGVSQVIYISDPRPGFELETSGELLNNSDSWAPSPDLLSLKFWEWGRNLYCESFSDDFNALRFGEVQLFNHEEKSGEQILITFF